MIYLDHNATTPPSPAVCRAMAHAQEHLWHNPSSLHRPGQEARHALELARREVASLLSARPREIVFTGSGTEALDLAIRGSIAATGKRVLVTNKGEHAAVRKLAEAFTQQGDIQVRYLPLDRQGLVQVDHLPDLLAPGDVALASIQWANNETGTIQPIEQIGQICRQHNTRFHTDATQWVGKEPTDVRSLPVDLLTCAPHKFYGPKGVGILWARSGVGLRPMLLGSQELARRGGTENTAAIIGTGVAAAEAQQWLSDPQRRNSQRAVRDQFEQSILRAWPQAQVNGPREPHLRMWNTSNIGFPRIEGQALLLSMSERGVCVSGGSACASGSIEPSPVLLAMGVPEAFAHGSLRFSIGKHTTAAECQRAVEILTDCLSRLSAALPV